MTDGTGLTSHTTNTAIHVGERERERNRKGGGGEKERERNRGRDEDLQEQSSPIKPVGHSHFPVAMSQVPLPHPPQSSSSTHE